ncbi:AraC family transcriptional regulator [Paenibacillus antri]|uniref:AraC family transcriptional regulator n=1 Tax=Paenibacillus antri TaxID=2582848 RepID=A0A5R9G3S6_9BACL|nr:AraC family transcriptional regulator [Paenibacillus antri]TLS49659.1 AraC family transcriptional regulator [Paenibacillus antri]
MRDRNFFPVLTELELQLPMYLTSAGGWINQERTDRPDGFFSFQWIQCLRGQGRLELGGAAADVGEGQGMLLYAGVPHRYYAVQEPWSVVWVTFHGSVVPEMLERLRLKESGVYTVSEPESLLEQLDRAAEVMSGSDPLRGYEGSALLYRLLLDLAKRSSFKAGGSRQQHLQSIAPMLRLIEERYADDLSLDDLAGSLGVTPQYACALFRRSFGMRPFEYVTKHRLRRAKELLLADFSLAVAEVGRRVGYGHTSYFIKLFKQQEGMTPSQFRQLFLG